MTGPEPLPTEVVQVIRLMPVSDGAELHLAEVLGEGDRRGEEHLSDTALCDEDLIGFSPVGTDDPTPRCSACLALARPE